jgi:hypothetical protein
MAQTHRTLLERVRESDGRQEDASPAADPRPPAPQHGRAPALAVVSRERSASRERGAHAGQPLPPHLLSYKKTVHGRLLGRHAVDVDPARRQEIRDKIVELLE